jgi:hypothetical protein
MVNLVMRQLTFICFTCCFVWRGMSTESSSRRCTHIFCVNMCHRRQGNLPFKETSKMSRIVRENCLKCHWSKETYFQLISIHLHMFGTVLWFEGWNSDRDNGVLSSLNSPERFCGPKQPPIQWVPVYFYGVQRSGRDFDHSLANCAHVKNGRRYISSSPVCPQSVGWDIFVFFTVPWFVTW